MNILKIVKLLNSTEEDRQIAVQFLLKDYDLLIKVAGIAFLAGITNDTDDTDLVREKLGNTYDVYNRLNHILRGEVEPGVLINSVIKTLL